MVRKVLVLGLVALLALTCLVSFVSAAKKPGKKSPKMELCIEDDACFISDDDNARGICWQRALQLGARHIRVMVYWHWLANCDPNVVADKLRRFNRIIDEGIPKGFKVQMVFTGVSANWGQACAGAKPIGVNPSPAAYSAIVQKYIVEFNRRGKGATRFSLYNEPNHPAFLCAGKVIQTGANVDAAKCVAGKAKSAKLLRKLYTKTYKAIQGLKKKNLVAKSTQIFIGETAGVDPAFMKTLFSGKKIVADGFSVHPYEYCQNPKTKKMLKSCKGRVMSGISYLGKVKTMLASLHKQGKFSTPKGKQVPLYLTEFGYWRTTEVGVPEPTRAKWYPMALDVALKSGAKSMNLYQLWPAWKVGLWDTSILEANGSGTPSFYSIRKWAKSHGYPVLPV